MEGSEVPPNGPCTFNTNGFYGRGGASRERIGRVSQGLRHMELNPPPREFCTRLLGPPATWKVFPRQAQAIVYAQTQGQGLMVFAYEGDAVGTGGQRRYLVSHPRQMWQRQRERRPDHRSSYEVIQSGAVCKLYFDLEFLCVYNSLSDGIAMTHTFMLIVAHFFQQEFNLACKESDVLNLCSSSEIKFSRHLIFNVPNAGFVDNINAGKFVSMVCNKIRAWDEGREQVDIPGVDLCDVKKLFVVDSRNNKTIFCDEGVYTKNRNFRLYLSTKHRKQRPLFIAVENQYSPSPCSGTSQEEQIFLDSLVTLVDESSAILSYWEEDTNVKRCKLTNDITSTKSELDGRGHSPYPDIDDFIEKVVSPGGIRRWSYFSHGAMIVYEIAQNRFCHNIGRQHRSNGIMYVVDLKNATYYQKCHDQDCYGFRSPAQPLPEDVAFWRALTEEIPWITSTPIDDGLANEFENQQLLSEVERLENSREVEDSIMAEAEMMSGVSDQRLVDVAEAMDQWYRLDCSSSSSSSGSIFKSQESSQGSFSNPWDKLSLLPSPSPSCIDQTAKEHQRTGEEVWVDSSETDCEKELVLATSVVESQGGRADWEVEWII